MSNYPPGMTARDYDHVEGPLEATETGERCPRCGGRMLREQYRMGALIACDACAYSTEEEFDPNDYADDIRDQREDR